jgi:hypothetical protein
MKIQKARNPTNAAMTSQTSAVMIVSPDQPDMGWAVRQVAIGGKSRAGNWH